MTDIKKHTDNECIDTNLDRLLELGESISKMPDELKDRIRSRLIQISPESGKNKTFPMRWVIFPLTAAAAVIFFIIFPWQGNISGSVTWAVVQKQLEQFHTVSCRVYTKSELADGNKLVYRSNFFQKDPFYKREEWEILKSAITGMEPGSNVTYLAKLEPGRFDSLMLYDKSRQAHLDTWLWNADNWKANPFQSVLNGASNSWEVLKKITEDETRIIGERIINGIPTVGFSIDNGSRIINFPGSSTVVEQTRSSGELWVNSNDGTPVLYKGQGEEKTGTGNTRKIYVEYTDIQWNTPLDENLFNIKIPEGWQTIKTQVKSIKYENNKLASGISMKVHIFGESLNITEKDVKWVYQAVETSYSGSDNKYEISITVELTPEATRRLQENDNINKNVALMVDFDVRQNITAQFDEEKPARLSFTIADVDHPLSWFEKKYFTKSLYSTLNDG